MQSSSAGNDWLFNVAGTQSVSYVNASDSDARTYPTINASDGTNFDAGGNHNWQFPPISKIVFTTSVQSITAGVISAIMTIQTQDSSSNPCNVNSGTNINLTSSSGNGKFYSDAEGTDQITSVTITTGINSASFYYKDTTAGSPTLTATESPSQGWTSATQQETITAAAATVIMITTQPSGAIAGTTFGTQPVIKTCDAYGNLSTMGLAASELVIASINTGTGPLEGTLQLDIGTGYGNGTITYTDLSMDVVQAGAKLDFALIGFNTVTSSAFNVEPKINPPKPPDPPLPPDPVPPDPEPPTPLDPEQLDTGHGSITTSWSQDDDLYKKKNYAAGKYKTVVIVYEGKVAVSPYDEKGPNYSEGTMVTPGNETSSEGEIKA